MICKFVLSSWLQLEMIRYGKEMAGGQREEGIIQKKKKTRKEREIQFQREIIYKWRAEFWPAEKNQHKTQINRRRDEPIGSWLAIGAIFLLPARKEKESETNHSHFFLLVLFCYFVKLLIISFLLFFFIQVKLQKNRQSVLLLGRIQDRSWRILVDPFPPPPQISSNKI